MTRFDAVRILQRLSDSQDKNTLERRLRMFKINFGGQKRASFCLDRIEKIIKIRR